MLEEIKQKILVKFGLVEGAAAPMVDTATGEIIEEEKAVKKPSKKNLQ